MMAGMNAPRPMSPAARLCDRVKAALSGEQRECRPGSWSLYSIYFLFPATSTQVDGWLIAPRQHLDTRSDGCWPRHFDLFWTAVDQDFAFAARVQRGLDSGANQALCFGENEFACEAFHASVQRMADEGA